MVSGWRRWLNIAILVVGVAVLVFGFWVGRGPVTCRGTEMQPGDVCRKSSFTNLNSNETQTYEQRVASARASRPTVIGLGVAMAAFGGFLIWQGRHKVAANPLH